jgi:D-cysteine desulfhydrase
MDAEQRQNVLAVAAFGARVELVGGVGEALAAAEKSAVRDPKRYVIPPGGSSPLGTVGFVRAGLELAEQARRNALPEPSRVYLPLGTMGSALGLALGLAAAGLRTKVYAVRVSNAATSSEAALARLTKETRAWLEARDPAFREVAAPALTIVGHQLGRGYALPTAAATKAVDLAAEHGLSLETTYTGKCLAALLDEATALRDEPVVFWNTHSSVALPGGEADIAKLPGPLAAVLRTPR